MTGRANGEQRLVAELVARLGDECVQTDPDVIDA